jgi:hypothetical protein
MITDESGESTARWYRIINQISRLRGIRAQVDGTLKGDATIMDGDRYFSPGSSRARRELT